MRFATPQPHGSTFSPSRPSRFVVGITTFVVATMALSWAYIASTAQGKPSPFTSSSLDRAFNFFSDLAGSGSSYWQTADWAEVGRLTADTVAMSVLAAVMAGLIAVLLIPFAASNLAKPGGRGISGVLRTAIYAITRLFFMFTRSVPELMWALVVVFVISPGILAGAIALAVHNLGVIGRLGADIVEDVESAPITALESTGASPIQRYVTGVLPLVARQFMTFQFYRWEVIIRTTAVVGFVAASGLGYQLRLDLSFFRYAEVGHLLIAYVLIVWSVDILSTFARRSIR